MNREEFTKYLQNTDKLTTDTAIELNGLIGEFPYCQSARILLTLSLFKEKNIKYDSELKATAVYVNNRGVLRKHIDRLDANEIKVGVAKEEAVKPENKKSDNAAKEIVVDKEQPKVEKSEPTTQDDTVSIAEVKSIIERHLRELEAEHKQKIQDKPIPKGRTKPIKPKNELIEDFIKNQPSISRPKTEFFDPVHKAKESIVDNENIVSETLANIYRDQGYHLKAIKIYQKLILKFPEKSSYFAALIKKAEKELES